MEGGTGGVGTGGNATLLVDGGTLSAGRLALLIAGQGGSSANSDRNIAGGNSTGGHVSVRGTYSGTFTATGNNLTLAALTAVFTGTIDNLRLYRVDSAPASLPAAPTLTGTAKAGATVTISNTSGGSTTVLGTTVANSSGVWTFVVTGITSGTHSITATQTDLATGLTSGASGAFAWR